MTVHVCRSELIRLQFKTKIFPRIKISENEKKRLDTAWSRAQQLGIILNIKRLLDWVF